MTISFLAKERKASGGIDDDEKLKRGRENEDEFLLLKQTGHM